MSHKILQIKHSNSYCLNLRTHLNTEWHRPSSMLQRPLGHLFLTCWPNIDTHLTLVGRPANTWLRLSWSDRGHYQKSGPRWGPQGLHYSAAQRACCPDRSGHGKPPPSHLDSSLRISSSLSILSHHLVFSLKMYCCLYKRVYRHTLMFS